MQVRGTRGPGYSFEGTGPQLLCDRHWQQEIQGRRRIAWAVPCSVSSTHNRLFELNLWLNLRAVV